MLIGSGMQRLRIVPFGSAQPTADVVWSALIGAGRKTVISPDRLELRKDLFELAAAGGAKTLFKRMASRKHQIFDAIRCFRELPHKRGQLTVAQLTTRAKHAS